MAEAVPAGYKQTEVGVIPEDWDLKRLGELGDVVRGGSPRPAGDPRYFNGHFIPWLTVAALTNIPEHQLDVSKTETALTREGSMHSRTLQAGTLIIANSGATLGIAKFLGITCCANDGIAAVVGQREGDKRFICFYINTQTRKLRDIVATGNGQPNLNTGLISNLLVPFPPADEQHAIADALGDVDALLGALDRLIAKKRNLKQAAMQQLLTARTRLPGFTGEWALTRLGNVLAFQVGFPFPSVEFNKEAYGQRLVKNRDLKADDEVIYYGGAYAREFLVNDGDVLVGMDGDFVPCLWSKGVALLNQRVGRIVSLSHVDSRYAYYCLREPLEQIQRQTSGTTVKHLSHGDVANICLCLPSRDEQTAIAAVLSDMDAEIAALEARRAKTHDVKQTMMQELLTGRTRLV